MNSKSSMFLRVSLALIGSLGIGIASASAQSVYLETYAQPFPSLESYQVVTAPRYIGPPAILTPPPIVRERTILVSRPGYVSAPLVVGPPIPPPYVIADW